MNLFYLFKDYSDVLGKQLEARKIQMKKSIGTFSADQHKQVPVQASRPAVPVPKPAESANNAKKMKISKVYVTILFML